MPLVLLVPLSCFHLLGLPAVCGASGGWAVKGPLSPNRCHHPTLSLPALSCSQVHGECETVRTSFRPVPLTWNFCHATPPPPAKRSGQRGAAALASDSGGNWSDGSGDGGGSGAAAPSPGARLLPLLDPSGRRINPALLPPAKRFGEEGADEEWGRWDGARRAKVGGRGAPACCRLRAFA